MEQDYFTFEFSLFVIGFFVVFGIPIYWWIFIYDGLSGSKKVDAAVEAETERFRYRQMHPDYDAFRKKYGTEPPEALKKYLKIQAFLQTTKTCLMLCCRKALKENAGLFAGLSRSTKNIFRASLGQALKVFILLQTMDLVISI